MNQMFDAPDGNITTWICPGTSKKHMQPPQVVIIQRVGQRYYGTCSDEDNHAACQSDVNAFADQYTKSRAARLLF